MLQYRKLKPILERLPIQLNAKQIELIAYDGDEALFGGAAGGGKTIAALVWLLIGIDIPGYNAAVFRKYQTDTKDDESALATKAAQLYPAFGGKLVGYRWMFPAGSSIVLEGIAHESALLSKQGKEYHKVVFEELTHFSEQAYQFVTTTRMRRVKSMKVKCGVRGTANPGGPGHLWVKERFITEDAILKVRELPTYEPTPYGMVFYKDDVAYLPSRAADNPALDVEHYINTLLKGKNPVLRAQMMNGDWGITPEGLIKPHWLRYYRMRDKNIDLLVSRVDNGKVIHTSEALTSFHENACRRFVTIDTAGGMQQITDESKGKPLSWTVVGVWDSRMINRINVLILRHVWRDRVEFTEACRKVREIYKEWHPSRIRVENETMGPSMCSLLRGEGIPIDMISHEGKDKVTRNTPLLNLMETGNVYLPQYENSWRPTYESELLSWQGLKDETNDQVDMSGYAAIEAGGLAGTNTILSYDPRSRDTQPVATSQGFMSGWF